jgi:hypothetical protein
MNSGTGKADFRMIFGEFAILVGRHWLLILLVALALTALDTVFEAAKIHQFTAAGNIGTLIASYLVILTVLRRESLIEDEGSFGSYFGASFLSGIGMLLGLILLIVPGLFLLARWSIASTLTITRHLGARDALKESWDMTQDSTWILIGVYLAGFTAFMLAVFGTGFLGGFVGLLVGMGDRSASSLTLSAVINLAVELGVVAGSCLNVAIYKQIVGIRPELAEVFA